MFEVDNTPASQGTTSERRSSCKARLNESNENVSSEMRRPTVNEFVERLRLSRDTLDQPAPSEICLPGKSGAGGVPSNAFETRVRGEQETGPTHGGCSGNKKPR